MAKRLYETLCEDLVGTNRIDGSNQEIYRVLAVYPVDEEARVTFGGNWDITLPLRWVFKDNPTKEPTTHPLRQ